MPSLARGGRPRLGKSHMVCTSHRLGTKPEFDTEWDRWLFDRTVSKKRTQTYTLITLVRSLVPGADFTKKSPFSYGARSLAQQAVGAIAEDRWRLWLSPIASNGHKKSQNLILKNKNKAQGSTKRELPRYATALRAQGSSKPVSTTRQGTMGPLRTRAGAMDPIMVSNGLASQGWLRTCRPLVIRNSSDSLQHADWKEFPVPLQVVEDSERGAPRFEPAVKAREEGISTSLTVRSETTEVSLSSCEVRRTP